MITLENLRLVLKSIKEKVDEKQDKEDGKSLSTNDYTTQEKEKLGSIVGLPVVTAADNGKILKVVNGEWALVPTDDNNL